MNFQTIISKVASSIPKVYLNILAVFLGIFLSIIIAMADYSVGSEISFSIFYTIPVAYFTWYFNYPLGIIDCFINALIWGFVDFAVGNTYSHPLIPIWNIFVRLGFFVIIASLLSKVKQLLEIEKRLSRTDHLTGAINSRCFFEIL